MPLLRAIWCCIEFAKQTNHFFLVQKEKKNRNINSDPNSLKRKKNIFKLDGIDMWNLFGICSSCRMMKKKIRWFTSWLKCTRKKRTHLYTHTHKVIMKWNNRMPTVIFALSLISYDFFFFIFKILLNPCWVWMATHCEQSRRINLWMCVSRNDCRKQ